MNIIPQIADVMQIVLTTTADCIGRLTGFVKRERKLTGSGFVQTVVFGWLAKPDASIEELTQTAAALGIEITPQGLDYRFNYEASECLKQTLESAAGALIADNPVAIPILRRFKNVYIQDSSIVVLPDYLSNIWQGCGGSSEKNTQSSVKLQVRLNMNTGGVNGPYLQAGRVNDLSSFLQNLLLPKGALRIADLGYFSLENLSHLDTQGVYWLSKIFSQCQVYDPNGKEWDLKKLLTNYCDTQLDMPILLGVKERLPCRMLARRVPEEVAQERRRKIRADATRRGKMPPKKQLELADWTIIVVCVVLINTDLSLIIFVDEHKANDIVTSVPSDLLTVDEAFVLLRLRWQIELLFKLWKRDGKIDDWRSEKPWRILCEFYAKLLAMLIQHWILLSGCWRFPDRSLAKAAQTVRKHALHLAVAFASFNRERLHEALEIIVRCLSFGCRLNKRRAKPNTYQLLLEVTGDA